MPWAGNVLGPLDYMAVTCHVPAKDLDEAVAIFLSWGTGGVEWEDGQLAVAPYADIPLLPGQPFVRAYFPLGASWPESQARVEAEARQRGWAVDYREVFTQDWESSWKQYYHTILLPEGYAVVPAWNEEPGPVAQDRQIILDPAQAFGTGTHPTTLMCLEQIIAENPRGRRVLDLGAGSGILAILAARMGAGRIVAVEPDPVAFRVLADNVLRNGSAIDLVLGTLSDVRSDELFDLALLNLIADIIIPEWPHLLPHLAPGGRAILSGILSERSQAVADTVEMSGAHVETVTNAQGWAMMVVAR